MIPDAVVLLGKTVGSIGLAVLGVLLCRAAARRAWAAAQVERVAWMVWLATRLGTFALLFVVLGLPVTSDAAVQYTPQGLAALDGQVPHRDFASSYGLLFPYLAGSLLWISPQPAVLVFAAIVLEGLGLYVWPRAVEGAIAERVRAEALLLFSCAPIAVWTTAIAGHNQSWLSLFLALAFGALARDRLALSAIWLILGAIAVKALALVPLPYLLLRAARDGRSLRNVLLAIGLSSVALVAPFGLLGAEPWRALVVEGARATSGNLPYLLGLFGIVPARPPLSWWLIAALIALIIAASAWAALRSARTGSRAHHAALCIVMLVLMLVSKKAYTTYLAIFWLPMCFVVAAQGSSGRSALAFAMLNVLAVVEPALWFDWIGSIPLQRALERLPSRGASYAIKLAAFMVCELGLLAGYAWLLRKAARALVPSRAEVGS